MSEPQDSSPENKRFGFVAVVGAPNAGKSTLVNALTGTKVAIVSHKVQTTRTPIRGIAIAGVSQLVFIDTPGIFAPRRRLDRAMVGAAWTTASDADLVLLVVDAARAVDENVVALAQGLKAVPHPCLLVLNKIDRLTEKDRLLSLAASLSEHAPFAAVFMISATTGNGVNALRDDLARRVPQGPWHYPEDEVSDVPMRVLAAEITREKIYHRLHQELPYESTVETDSWKELKDGSVRIEQTVFVERDSQKSIVLGAGGQTIKQISSESRTELAEILERPVHLFLFVKVRENWTSDPARYREMGLEFPKDE